MFRRRVLRLADPPEQPSAFRAWPLPLAGHRPDWHVNSVNSPFIEEQVDVEAQILRRNLRRERVIRPRLDVLSFPDEYLFERFRFSASTIIYINNILRPHMTHRGHALSS